MNEMCVLPLKNLQSRRVGTYISSFIHKQTAISALQALNATETLPCPPGAQQVAKAVNNATKQSLVLVDEFGKGTNTVRRQKEEKLRRGRWGRTEEHEGDAVPRERNRVHGAEKKQKSTRWGR